MTVTSLLRVAALLLSASLTRGGCDECEADVAALAKTWTNATAVEEILAGLEDDCAATFGKLHPVKRGFCDKVAEVLVQIPPGLFQGIQTLAWPLPLGVCATLGECETPCCDAGATPEQVHLSLAGNDPSRMGVSWTTLEPRNASLVQYYEVSSSSSSSSSVAADVRTVEGTVGTYAWGGWQGAIHRAAMVGLEPDTTYAYRVGDGSDGGWAPSATSNSSSSTTDGWFMFKTLPAAEAFEADPSKSVTFAVVADMGYGVTSDETIANLAELTKAGAIQGVIHSGDVSYADGFMPHWDAFLNKVQPIASAVPYMTTPGNHELWYNFSAYKHRFLMPGVPPLDAASGTAGVSGSGADGMYYSWSLPGLASFAALDSETPYDTAKFGAAQRAWMGDELGAADGRRSERPWSIAHFHRPLYCSNNHEDCFEFAPVLRREAEATFVSSRVDLVLNGHVHDYERTFPTANSTATQHAYDYSDAAAAAGIVAPTYVTQGASGNREGNSGFPSDLPDWSAGHASEVGFGLLTVSRAKLDWQFFNATAAGPVLLDSFSMTK